MLLNTATIDPYWYIIVSIDLCYTLLIDMDYLLIPSDQNKVTIETLTQHLMKQIWRTCTESWRKPVWFLFSELQTFESQTSLDSSRLICDVLHADVLPRVRLGATRKPEC